MSMYVAAATAGTMTVLAGLALLVAALTGTAPHPPPRRAATPPRALGRARVGVPGRTGVTAAVAAVVALLVTGWPAVAAGAGAVAVLLPRMAASRTATQVHIARLEALAGWTRRVADLLASGAASSLQDGLARSAATAPAPIRADLAALAARLRTGGVEAALRGFADDVADPVADQVAMALVVRARHGGAGLAKVLTVLATDVDDQVRMRRTIAVERDKTLASSRAVVVLTLAVWAAALVFTADYLAPYGTAVGQVVLAGIVALFAAALAWLARLSAPVTGPRLLAPPPSRGTS